MIVVATSLDKRLDEVWYRLQRIEQEYGAISQIDIDTACLDTLERFVVQLGVRSAANLKSGSKRHPYRSGHLGNLEGSASS